ncbi:MAG: phage portal protein [Methylomicrobium sp.]|nr:phage portal protein [Methylomicrobium sp.]
MGIMRFFGFGQSAALTNRYGRQIGVPGDVIIDHLQNVTVDGAMQIATVWRAVEIIAKTISTLPIMVYSGQNGERDVARSENLWALLHDRPNARQTPMEFWIAMLLNLLLRGNAYAEIKRNPRGVAIALIVLPADQVEMEVMTDGNDIYHYSDGVTMREIRADDVLHIREMTGGHVGMSRLEYMRASLSEHKNTQSAANTLFARGGRTTGVLSPAGAINDKQWMQLQDRVNELYSGNKTIQVLPGDMKFSQINLTPQDIQLLTTRQFTVQEIGRWFGVPAILLNQTEGTTTLGSSSSDIIESFEKLTLRPIVINIEQAIRHRVMTASERIRLDVEFNMDGLLRASLKDRIEIYAKAVQNGVFNRNETRQLENMPPYAGGDAYTVQSNLIPVDKLGENINTGGSVPAETVGQ